MKNKPKQDLTISLLKSIFNRFKGDGKSVLNLHDYPVTCGFAMLCFLVPFLSFIPESWHVFNLSYTIDHWRELSGWASIFLSWISHAGIYHLLGNMMFWLLIAPKVEKRLGTKFSIAMIAFTGLCSSLAWALDGNWYYSALGASGIIYGFIGAFITLSKRGLLAWLLISVILASAGLEYIARFSDGDGVAHMAHVGGFIGGIIGTLWCLAFKKDELRKVS